MRVLTPDEVVTGEDSLQIDRAIAFHTEHLSIRKLDAVDFKPCTALSALGYEDIPTVGIHYFTDTRQADG